MFKAVLFDLDATLLNIDMDYFLKKYFQKMMVMVAEWGLKSPDKFVQKVLKSTDVMIADLNPNTTNEEAFMTDFFTDGRYSDHQSVQAFLNHFYEAGFPELAQYCQPFQGIPEMMARLMDKGFKVVIATNAVFPMTALEQRMSWAGIGSLNYDLITSFEIMHFCKPHPQYYREITEMIKVDPADCLMVGNDMGEDLPAAGIGMKTFLVEDMLIAKDVEYIPDWRGTRTALYKFLDGLKSLR